MTLAVNMKQMHKWQVTADNVQYYSNIMVNNGRFFSLDYRPYIELLTEFNIFWVKHD